MVLLFSLMLLFQARLRALPPIYLPPKLGSGQPLVCANAKRVEAMSKIAGFSKEVQSLLEVKLLNNLCFLNCFSSSENRHYVNKFQRNFKKIFTVLIIFYLPFVL